MKLVSFEMLLVVESKTLNSLRHRQIGYDFKTSRNTVTDCSYWASGFTRVDGRSPRHQSWRNDDAFIVEGSDEGSKSHARLVVKDLQIPRQFVLDSPVLRYS